MYFFALSQLLLLQTASTFLLLHRQYKPTRNTPVVTDGTVLPTQYREEPLKNTEVHSVLSI